MRGEFMSLNRGKRKSGIVAAGGYSPVYSNNVATSLKEVNRIEMAAKAAEFAETSAMFTLGRFFSSAWTELTNIILFPLLLLFNAFQTVSAWRDVMIEGRNVSAPAGHRVHRTTLAKAMIYTASTALLGVALLGMFLVSFGSLLIAPILFCAAYAVKALYHLGKAIYHGAALLRARRFTHQDPAVMAYHTKQLQQEFVLAITSTVVTIALGLTFFLTKLTMGFGIVFAAVGAAYCAYKAVQKSRAKATPRHNDSADEHSQSDQHPEAEVPANELNHGKPSTAQEVAVAYGVEPGGSEVGNSNNNVPGVRAASSNVPLEVLPHSSDAVMLHALPGVEAPAADSVGTKATTTTRPGTGGVDAIARPVPKNAAASAFERSEDRKKTRAAFKAGITVFEPVRRPAQQPSVSGPVALPPVP